MSHLIQLPASTITLKPEFARSNFGPSDYLDKNGDPRRLLDLTRNGSLFLDTGYAGAPVSASACQEVRS